jgi:alpha-galactosidase
VIAVDQDKLGIQGFVYSAKEGMEVWLKPLDGGAWTMCVLNRTARPQKFQFDWKKEVVADNLSQREAKFDTTTYSIRDLWTKQNLGTTKEPLNAEVPSHDVLMLRLNKM